MRRAKRSTDLHPELGLPEVRKLWQTEGLFSDHYLKSRLNKNEWWPTDAQTQPIWQFCKGLYEKRYLACAKNTKRSLARSCSIKFWNNSIFPGRTTSVFPKASRIW